MVIAIPQAAEEAPRVAVVTVNFRTPELTLACVRSVSVERERLPDLRMIVVDGGSGDGSTETIAAGLSASPSLSWVSLLPLQLNGGFGWANNQAILHLLQSTTPPDYVHLLNPDARIEPGAIESLVRFLHERPDCAAVGSSLLDPAGEATGSAFRFPSVARELVSGAAIPALGRLLRIPGVLLESGGDAIQADWVTGASVMIRVAALRDSGLFDDGFFLYFEEVELMWRLRRAGWEIWHQPASRVYHDEGAATGVRNSGERTAVQPARPRYWYESQHRYFYVTGGFAGSAMATLAWCLGYVIRIVAHTLRLPVAGPWIAREWRDRVTNLLHASRARRIGGVTTMSDAIGALPRWMGKRA